MTKAKIRKYLNFDDNLFGNDKDVVLITEVFLLSKWSVRHISKKSQLLALA